VAMVGDKFSGIASRRRPQTVAMRHDWDDEVGLVATG
jgi:hypothetical protein